MEISEKKSCAIEDDLLPHGAEMDEDGRALICIDGKWVDKDSLESVGC